MKRYKKIQASSNNYMFDKIKDAVDIQVLSYYMRGGCSEEECRKYFKVEIETRPNWYDDGSDMHRLMVYLDALEPDDYESSYLADRFINNELKDYSNDMTLEDIEDIEVEPTIYGNVEELQYNYLDPLVKKFNKYYYFEKDSSYVLACNLDY